MRRSLRRLRYRVYIRWLALQWILQINLGDTVIHKGRKRGVINWAGSPLMTLSNPYEEHVPREEIRKAWTLGNAWHSYTSGVDFYTRNWLDVWVQNGIQPWVRRCAIWPRWRRR